MTKPLLLIRACLFAACTFGGGQDTQSHEIGHQWINHLSQPTLAPAVAHWPLSTMANGTMGFTIPGTGAGGEYSCRLVPVAGGIQLEPFSGPRAFNDMDLYLMGLKPANQVPTQYVWKDQAAALASYNANHARARFRIHRSLQSRSMTSSRRTACALRPRPMRRRT